MTDIQLYIYAMGLCKSSIHSSRGSTHSGGPFLHVSVVIFGKEYSFSGKGVDYVRCNEEPNAIRNLGKTNISEIELDNFVKNLSETEFKGVNYHIAKRSCVHFARRVCNFLNEKCNFPPDAWFQTAMQKGLELHESRGLVYNVSMNMWD